MKKAFTLAEVLITLAIIGIVAAVTIPSVIANYQQHEFKTGLRKAVSVLNEAIQTNIVQEGETPYEMKGNGADGLFEYLQRHMSILKTGHSKYNNSRTNDVFYTTDGMRFEMGYGANVLKKLHEGGEVQFTFKSKYDGLSITLNQYGCGSYGLKNNPHNTINPPCLVMVDVNGDRKPNPQSGGSTSNWWQGGTITNYSAPILFTTPEEKQVKDVFTIMITEDRAIPYGVVAQRAMYEK